MHLFTDFLPTEREGRITKNLARGRGKMDRAQQDRYKTTECHYFPVRYEQVKLVVYYMPLGPNFFTLNWPAFTTVNFL